MGKVRFSLYDTLNAMKELHSAPIGTPTGDYYHAADYAALEAENKRLIDIAGDALGFSEYQRDQDTVEVLANHCKRLAEEFAAVKGELAECKMARERLSNRLLEIHSVCGELGVNGASTSPIDIITTLRARCERLEGELVFIHRRLSASDDSYNKVSVVIGSIELRFPDIAKQALEVPNG